MTSIKDALRLAREYIDEESQSDSVWSTQMAAKAIKAIDAALATLTTPAPGQDELRERNDVPSWPPVKKAVWDVIVGENLNDGHYIKAFDLTAKLYDAILSALPVAPVVDEAAPIAVVYYTNWRGETSRRRIIPKSVRYGSTEWHPEPQWLMLAWDDDKQADREFALKDFGTRAGGGER